MPANIKQLDEKAILVNVAISRWGARRFEGGAAEELAQEHGSAADELSVTKRLLPKHGLKAVTSAVYEIRKHWLTNTLPWNDNGWRLLPTKNYFGFMEKHRKLVSTLDAAADDLCFSMYEALKREQRLALNGLYRESDYPPADQLRRRFRIALDFMNVPQSGDIRAALPDAELGEIKAAVEKATAERVQHAVGDLYQRIGDVLKDVRERLAAYQPGTDEERAKGAFRKSILDGIKTLIDVVPRLNLTDDEQLTSLHGDLVREFSSLDAESLKDADTIRQGAVEGCDAILAKMAGMFGGSPTEQAA